MPNYSSKETVEGTGCLPASNVPSLFKSFVVNHLNTALTPSFGNQIRVNCLLLVLKLSKAYWHEIEDFQRICESFKFLSWSPQLSQLPRSKTVKPTCFLLDEKFPVRNVVDYCFLMLSNISLLKILLFSLLNFLRSE